MNIFVLPKTKAKACLRAVVLTVLILPTSYATELVYAPVNPTFGGNPNNGSVLLSGAQAQNSYKAPTLSPVEKFNNSMQQAILSRLESNALNYMFGKTDTLTAKTYETATFSVVITDVAGGKLKVETTDKTTGATATFTVDALAAE